MSETTPNESAGAGTETGGSYSPGRERRTYEAAATDEHPVENRVARTVVSKNADGTLRYYTVRVNVVEEARRRDITALNSELR